MPKVACPKCKKRYDVPHQAVGRFASCKCGQRFKVTAPPPPEPKEPDSLWGELDDEYEVEPPSVPAPMPAMAGGQGPTAAPRPVAASAPAAWHAHAQLAFRIACYLMPTLFWALLYFWIASSSDRKPPLLMNVFFIGSLVVSQYVAWRVSAKGLRFGPDARRLRLSGLGICGAGLVASLAALLATNSIVQSLPGGMVVALLVLGVAFVSMIAGGLQSVTGRDLRSQLSSSDRG